jgi:hypothetical protein
MKTNIMKLVSSFITLIAFLCLVGNVTAEENYKLKYQAKVEQNNATIGIIAGVINYVCPRLIPAPESAKICNPDDPVGSAVGVQKYMERNWDKEEDDIEDAKMPELLNKKAALQFWDAVEQFKEHFPYRATAIKAAEKGDWQNALLNEEMAWQYLVKCASRGIFAKKIVDGE